MLQPNFPLKMSERDGSYQNHTELERSVKQNILFLMQTNPGEWPAKPELGIGVNKYLFENYTVDSLNNLKLAIKSQIKKYMPFLKVEVFFQTEDDLGNSLIDNNYVSMRLEYTIVPLSIDEILNFKVAETSIEVI